MSMFEKNVLMLKLRGKGSKMTASKQGFRRWFWERVNSYLPPEHRHNAAVAAIRTFGQTFEGGWFAAGGTATYLMADKLNTLDWRAILLGILVTFFNSAGAAIRAWWGVAVNGLSDKYIQEGS